mmetsp:Transcript_32557/g.66056  ORF Transcript_32557/g.66056 Transcript_32557/m.66056 type:complete len:233 (-) Transcript_32557:209-907(-)
MRIFGFPLVVLSRHRQLRSGCASHRFQMVRVRPRSDHLRSGPAPACITSTREENELIFRNFGSGCSVPSKASTLRHQPFPPSAVRDKLESPPMLVWLANDALPMLVRRCGLHFRPEQHLPLKRQSQLRKAHVGALPRLLPVPNQEVRRGGPTPLHACSGRHRKARRQGKTNQTHCVHEFRQVARALRCRHVAAGAWRDAHGRFLRRERSHLLSCWGLRWPHSCLRHVIASYA